jgi:hypothetical protein
MINKTSLFIGLFGPMQQIGPPIPNTYKCNESLDRNNNNNINTYVNTNNLINYPTGKK